MWRGRRISIESGGTLVHHFVFFYREMIRHMSKYYLYRFSLYEKKPSYTIQIARARKHSRLYTTVIIQANRAYESSLVCILYNRLMHVIKSEMSICRPYMCIRRLWRLHTIFVVVNQNSFCKNMSIWVHGY